MTTILTIDVRSEQTEELFRIAGNRAPVAIARAMNRVGVPVANKYRRASIKKLGARPHPFAKVNLRDWTSRATRMKKANPGTLTFSFTQWGKPLPAIFFSPIEKPAGTSIRYLGQRKLIPRAFYLGGQFPGRKRSGISHAVWQRLGPGRWTLGRPKGPSLAEAAIQPDVLAVWQGEASRRLPVEVGRQVVAILGGFAPAEYRTRSGMKGVL